MLLIKSIVIVIIRIFLSLVIPVGIEMRRSLLLLLHLLFLLTISLMLSWILLPILLIRFHLVGILLLFLPLAYLLISLLKILHIFVNRFCLNWSFWGLFAIDLTTFLGFLLFFSEKLINFLLLFSSYVIWFWEFIFKA